MIARGALVLLAVALLGAGAASGEPAIVRVRLVTGAGAIVVAVDTRHAPATSANFLAYVDDGRLDDTEFYRASRRKGAETQGFVQGGIGTNARRMLGRVPFEPTGRTGLRHVDGAISMARYEALDSATGNFSLMVGANPAMDARDGYPGYAVFGRVVGGMDVVRRMLAQPTSPGGDGAFKGQMLVRPVRIVRAERLDGTAKPTGQPKVWLLFKGM
ncbi:peptidylprolyl isomerase [uncultured Sphingomonas sp.]|uniref:peptidylprolyl isomerase n=1 Tax=uncultured Sphingomonas sp. TaxID=158754 RepID=UPI0035CA5417